MRMSCSRRSISAGVESVIHDNTMMTLRLWVDQRQHRVINQSDGFGRDDSDAPVVETIYGILVFPLRLRIDAL